MSRSLLDPFPEARADLAYLGLRSAIGLSMLVHGFFRIAKLARFRDGMVAEFAHPKNTNPLEPLLLPQPVVSAFASVLPFVEFAVGALLVVGLATVWTLIIADLTMFALIFGTGALENWSGIGLQIGYVAVFAALLAWSQHNRFALDHLLQAKRSRQTRQISEQATASS